MNVLSLFDGISCGQIALEKADIKVDNYFASEIDESAIRITQFNYPTTVQLGDIQKHSNWSLPVIDLLIGGSPCQGFSINGNRLNFDDPRSQLLFEYIKIRDKYKPKYWLLENVATMSEEIKHKIDKYIGIKGVLINSNSVSPQNRKRYYWTNIDFIATTGVSKLVISNILEDRLINPNYFSVEYMQKQYINPTTTDGVITINPKMFNGKQTYQQDRIYDCNGRMVALTATLGNRFRIKDNSGNCRKLTIREQARLQTIPDSYNFECVSNLQASRCIGNSWTVDVVANILKYIMVTEKHCLKPYNHV